jgi:hypothetical protein
VIASPPDATRSPLACAWCEQPLAPSAVRYAGQMRCGACGAMTPLSWPTESDARRSFARAAEQARGPQRLCTLGEAARRRARRRLAMRIGRVAPPGAVLDVGSGDRMLLDALRATGRLVTPIAGRAGGGARPGVQDAEITELGGRYAAIVFWQSLGRLRAPGAALEHAAALLKPGGMLAIAQPRAGRVQVRELGERLLAREVSPRHVRIPSQTLVARLRTLGLEVDVVDHLLDQRTPGGWMQGMLGGLISIEARR